MFDQYTCSGLCGLMHTCSMWHNLSSVCHLSSVLTGSPWQLVECVWWVWVSVSPVHSTAAPVQLSVHIHTLYMYVCVHHVHVHVQCVYVCVCVYFVCFFSFVLDEVDKNKPVTLLSPVYIYLLIMQTSTGILICSNTSPSRLQYRIHKWSLTQELYQYYCPNYRNISQPWHTHSLHVHVHYVWW